jgi:hypothetical protein
MTAAAQTVAPISQSQFLARAAGLLDDLLPPLRRLVDNIVRGATAGTLQAQLPCPHFGEAADVLEALEAEGGDLSVAFYRQIRGAPPSSLFERFAALKAEATAIDIGYLRKMRTM